MKEENNKIAELAGLITAETLRYIQESIIKKEFEENLYQLHYSRIWKKVHRKLTT